MGIRMTVYAVAATDLRRIVGDPPLVKHLFDCQPGSRAAADLPRELCDLDRAWEGIQRVLAGSMESSDRVLGFLMNGGDPIGDIDVGYGPARALAPDAVARVNTALAAISPEDFAARIDYAALVDEGTYGIGDDEESDRAYLEDTYASLREFVASAAAEGRGLIVAM